MATKRDREKRSKLFWQRVYVVGGALALIAVVCSVFGGYIHRTIVEALTALLQYLDDTDADSNEARLLLNLVNGKVPPPMQFFQGLGAQQDDDGLIWKTQHIKTVPWKPGGRFLRHVVATALPVLITDNQVVVNNWTFYQQREFDLFQFATQCNVSLPNTRLQLKEQLFVLGNDRDRGGMLGSAKDRPLAYVNISMTRLLETAADNKTFLYWSGELAQWEDSWRGCAKETNLTHSDKMLSWKSFRVVEPGLEAIIDIDDEAIWRPMVWLSHPGVVTQTHYDTQHNFLVQIFGKKTVLLFPPEGNGTSLYQYPNIHRSYRQSQVQMECRPSKSDLQSGQQCKDAASATIARFPRLTQSPVIQVTLLPGDILYIPPYWFHRVQAETLAVSLSVISPSLVEAILSDAYWQTVPFGVFKKSPGLRLFAIRKYLETVLRIQAENVTSDDYLFGTQNHTLSDLAGELYASRFSDLYPEENIRGYGGSNSHVSMQAMCDLSGENADELRAAAEQLLSEQYGNFEVAATKLIKTLRGLESPVGIKRTFLFDYIEQVTRWAVGPQLTPAAIFLCLAASNPSRNGILGKL